MRLDPTGAVRVAVTAPAVEGAANEAVVGALAAALGVRRSALTLVRGARGRRKTVQVRGLDTAEALERIRRMS